MNLKEQFGLALAVCLLAGTPALAADTNSVSRPGGYQFDGTISRVVLENYLARSITMRSRSNNTLEQSNDALRKSHESARLPPRKQKYQPRTVG